MLRIGAANIAKPSAESLDKLFGVISPNISTSTVITIVDTVGPYTGYNLVKSTVASDADAIFTILFPIRIVDKVK